MSAVAPTWSTARAIVAGHISVTLPALVAVALAAALGAFLSGPVGALAGALFGCCVLVWPVWAWGVRRWRHLIAARATSPREVQRFAVATGLIGPRGSVIEQAESTARVPLIWGSLAAGFAFFLALFVLIAKASSTLAIAFMAAGCVSIAAAIAVDRRRINPLIVKAGIIAGLVAGFAWVLLPRMPTPAWATAGLVTFATLFAYGLIALLIWLPGELAPRRRWTAIGVAAVAIVSVAAGAMDAARFTSPSTTTSQPPRIAVASPKVVATWASFTTGADKPRRTLTDGLQIIDVEPGSGTRAKAGDSLTVRYIMWLSDGRQVDSSDAAGTPFTFTLGSGEVIQGWEEGVAGMAVGGTRRLVVPPALAYGDRGAANQSGTYVVPPNTTLVFVVQLLNESRP